LYLLKNYKLKEQLGKVQVGFIRLTNNNVELTSTLNLEKHMKSQLAKGVLLKKMLGHRGGEYPQPLFSRLQVCLF
jgi:hypothetical protein